MSSSAAVLVGNRQRQIMIDVKVGIAELDIDLHEDHFPLVVLCAADCIVLSKFLGVQLRRDEGVDWKNDHIQMLLVLSHWLSFKVRECISTVA